MGICSVAEAVEALKRGEAVIFPTDTVYGLGVAVEYAPSPQVIYDLKRRDGSKPIAWLVGGLDDLDRYGKDVDPRARAFAERHWPGALTVIVKASQCVPRAYQANDGSVALRMPAHPTALDLVRCVGPIAASSANVSGGEAPRAFEDIDPDLTAAVSGVRASQEAGSGVASTVIDCARGNVIVVREGDVRVSPGVPRSS